MHSKKTGIKGLILVLAGLVALAAIAVVPTFGGGTGHATTTDLTYNLNRSATLSEFIIPGVPVATLAAKLGSGATVPVAITLNGPATDLTNTSGQLLIGKTELVNFDLSCATPPNQVCVTARAVVGTAKQHAVDTRVQVATQLTSEANDTTDAVQCDLGAGITATAQPPFTLQCGAGQAAAFGTAGFLTVQHSGTVLGLSSEYMQYDNSTCTAGTDQLCIVAPRALQPGNDKRAHLADGFTQPCVVGNGVTCTGGTTTGDSLVTKHFQLNVTSNAGFFPAAPLVVYTVDGSNVITGAEVINYNNAATKIKTAAATEFHAVTRGGYVATLERTAVSSHPAGSVVTGAHGQLVCRAGQVQPGVDTDTSTDQVDEPAGQTAGTSLATYPVCYTRTQPGALAKDTGASKKLNIPVIGSTLIVLNAVGIPFLSTGGLTGTVFGDIDHVDTNGPTDGSLVLTSPCIVSFTPGTNLKVDLTVNTKDFNKATADEGLITVVLDTIPGPGGGADGDVTTHDDCDDPAGIGAITLTTYSYYDENLAEDGVSAPNGECGAPSVGGTDAPPADDEDGDGKKNVADFDCYSFSGGATTHDTDGDGCSDIEELNPKVSLGGLRGPWNGQDFFDVGNAAGYADLVVPGDGAGPGSKDQVIDLFNDIVLTINSFASYNVSADHGGSLRFGPFGWHRSDPDGTTDLFNDIVGVIGQFGHKCQAAP